MKVYLLVEVQNRKNPDDCVGEIRVFMDMQKALANALPDDTERGYDVLEVEVEE